MVPYEEAVRGEELELNPQSQSRRGRLAVHKIHVGKAQTPTPDKFLIRNTQTHQSTP